MGYNNYFDTKKVDTIKKLINNYKPDMALKLIEEYIWSYPKDNLIYLYKAVCLSMLKRHEDALALADIYINKDFGKEKNYMTAYVLYAEVLAANKRVKEAVQYYEKAISISIESRKKPSNARIRLIQYYISIEEYGKALEKCIGFEESVIILVKKAICYSCLSNPKAVIDSLRNINPLRINNPHLQQDYYFYLGEAYYRSKNMDDSNIYQENYELLAIKYLNEVLKIPGSFVYYKALAYLGYICMSNYDYKGAIEYGKRIEREDPGDFFGYDLLTSVYTNMLDFEKAIKYAELISNDFKRNYKMAVIHYRKKEYKEAEECICHALSADTVTQHELLLKNYAYILYRLGKVNELKSLFVNITEPNYYIGVDRALLNNYIAKSEGQTQFSSYAGKQYYQYDKDFAIENIKGRTYAKRLMDAFNNKSIEEIYEIAYERIQNQEGMPFDFYDVYYMKPDENIESLTEKDIITVKTNPGTKEIVGIYPFGGSLNDNKQIEEESPKTKRKSQIEKFNERYNNYKK